MATEDLTGSDKFVDDLVATNPVATDSVSDGDEHIRGVKNVLKNTLPNVTAAVTATAAQLNKTTSTFTGADGSAAGASGMVTTPVATDNTKFLKGDGTWATPSGGSSTTAGVIWDNHSTTAYEYTNDSSAILSSGTTATDITVVDDKTLLLTHAADAGELRSVYVEKKITVPGVYLGVTYRYYRLVSDDKIQLKFWWMYATTTSTTNLATATTSLGGDGEWHLDTAGQVDDSVGRADDNLAAPFNPADSSNSRTWYKYEVNDNGWLRYDFGTSTNIRKMHIQVGYSGVDSSYVPSTIIIEGSNDASTWTQIGDTYTNTAEEVYFSYDIEDFGEQAVGSTYWQLESFDDWNVQFASSTTTKLINKTAADAVIRARITAPTAAGGGSSTTAGIIWDNHSTSTGYDYDNDGTAGTTSATAATDITVVDDKTLLLTHAADAGELRSVYVEKYIPAVAAVTGTEKTITAGGNIQHSTSNYKVGSSSLDFTDGTSYLDVAAHSDFNFAANASFTMEVWVKCASTSGTNLNNRVFQKGANQLDGYGVFIDATDVFFGRTDEKLLTFSRSLLVGTGNWHHVAVVRDTATIELYLDGVLKSNGTNGDALDGNDKLAIGRYPGLTDNRFNGYMDEFRISNIARYTTDFTPSTVLFDYDANTVLLVQSNTTTNGSTTFTDNVSAPVVPAYWKLESFDDWDVIFASSTTTKLINNTSADAVIRARITAPTASASQTLSGLADVDTGAITLIDGAVLRYNGTASEWQNTNLGLSLTPTVTIPSTIYPSPTTVTITITNWSSYSSPAPWCEVENSSGTVVVAASAVTNNGDGTMTFTAPSTAATYTLKVKVQDFGDLVSSTVSTSMVVSEAPSYEYRYFRIGSLGSTGSGYLAVVEFYTSAGFTGTYYPPAMTSNSQTIGGVTYALSGYSYNNTSYQLWKMTDISGYDPTKTGAWMLGASATQKSDGWVFDLGTARDIVSARCKWYTYSLPNTYHSSPFTLYGSSNGSSWTAINTVTMGATNDGEYVDMLLG